MPSQNTLVAAEPQVGDRHHLGSDRPDGDTVTLTITGVTQDEPLNGLGDGDTVARRGACARPCGPGRLRAERSGQRRRPRLSVGVRRRRRSRRDVLRDGEHDRRQEPRAGPRDRFRPDRQLVLRNPLRRAGKPALPNSRCLTKLRHSMSGLFVLLAVSSAFWLPGLVSSQIPASGVRGQPADAVGGAPAGPLSGVSEHRPARPRLRRPCRTRRSS